MKKILFLGYTHRVIAEISKRNNQVVTFPIITCPKVYVSSMPSHLFIDDIGLINWGESFHGLSPSDLLNVRIISQIDEHPESKIFIFLVQKKHIAWMSASVEEITDKRVIKILNNHASAPYRYFGGEATYIVHFTEAGFGRSNILFEEVTDNLNFDGPCITSRFIVNN